MTQFDAGVAIQGGSANTVTAMRVLDNRGSFTTDLGDGIAVFNSTSNRITNNQVLLRGGGLALCCSLHLLSTSGGD